MRSPLSPPPPDWTTLAPPLRSSRGPNWRHIPGRPRRRPRTIWGRPDPLDPHATPARPWAPLTDAEWEAVLPFLHACGANLQDSAADPFDETRPGRAGRRMADARARLDAIFRLVTMKLDSPKGKIRAPWRLLPAELGKPDTASRTHRRWAAAQFWYWLLLRAGMPGAAPVLAGMLHWICCAYRRAIRVMGIGAVVLARRLCLASALTAPEHWLPNPDLSEACRQLRASLRRAWQAKLPWQPPPGIRGKDDLALIEDRINGRRRIPRWAEPA
jgi:hypothetical protein